MQCTIISEYFSIILHEKTILGRVENMKMYLQLSRVAELRILTAEYRLAELRILTAE